MKKVIISDLGGTLCAHECAPIFEDFHRAFAVNGFNVSVKQITNDMGMSKWNHIWNILPEKYQNNENTNLIYKTFIKFQLDNIETLAEPIPGSLKALERYESKGWLIAVNTGFPKDIAVPLIHRLKEKGFKFDTFAYPEKNGRPYPDMIFKIMNELKTTNVVKVGDTPIDILEGKNAGVVSGVVYETSALAYSKDENYARYILAKEKPDFLIKNITCLDIVLDNIKFAK